jgi:hypothetical protein
MIPIWLSIKMEGEGRRFRLYLPLFLIWILLMPLVLLIGPIVAIVCLVRGINPFRAAWAMLRVLASVSGTRVEVQDGESSFFFRICLKRRRRIDEREQAESPRYAGGRKDHNR